MSGVGDGADDGDGAGPARAERLARVLCCVCGVRDYTLKDVASSVRVALARAGLCSAGRPPSPSTSTPQAGGARRRPERAAQEQEQEQEKQRRRSLLTGIERHVQHDAARDLLAEVVGR